jgi:uncharacterized membrane protein
MFKLLTKPGMLIIFLTVAGAVLRFYNLGGEPLWYDEAVSYSRAVMPLSEAIEATILTDTMPPFFYLILHFMLSLGDSEFIIRLFPAICGILVIPLTYSIGKTIGGKKLAGIAALLVTISPLLVTYSQEARSYSLYLLGATLAMWGLAKLLQQPLVPAPATITASAVSQLPPPTNDYLRRSGWAWAAYIVGSAITLQAVNTGFLFPLATNLVALYWLWSERQHWQRLSVYWITANTIVLLLWAPWLPGLLAQSRKVSDSQFWFGNDFNALLEVINDLWISYFWRFRGGLLIGLLAAIGFAVWNWRHQVRWIVFSLTLFLVPVVGSYIISQWMPILTTRVVIWAAIPLLLLIAAAIAGLRSRLLFLGALALVIALNLRGLGVYYTDYAKEEWDKTAHYIAENVQPNDYIMIHVGYLKKALDYYWRRTGKTIEIHPFSQQTATMPPASLAELTTLLNSHKRLWLVYSHSKSSDPQDFLKKTMPAAHPIMQQKFRGTGLQLNCAANCIEVTLYEINPR